MKQKLLTFYHALPVWVQGLIVAAEAGAIGFLVQWATNPQPLCLNRTCLKQFGGALLAAVIVSIRNWLRQSPLSGDAAERAALAAIAQKADSKP